MMRFYSFEKESFGIVLSNYCLVLNNNKYAYFTYTGHYFLGR